MLPLDSPMGPMSLVFGHLYHADVFWGKGLLWEPVEVSWLFNWSYDMVIKFGTNGQPCWPHRIPSQRRMLWLIILCFLTLAKTWLKSSEGIAGMIPFLGWFATRDEGIWPHMTTLDGSFSTWTHFCFKCGWALADLWLNIGPRCGSMVLQIWLKAGSK